MPSRYLDNNQLECLVIVIIIIDRPRAKAKQKTNQKAA